MKRTNNKSMQALQLFSGGKLSEFRHMSLRERLQWLEEANKLVRKVSEAKGKPRRERSDGR